MRWHPVNDEQSEDPGGPISDLTTTGKTSPDPTGLRRKPRTRHREWPVSCSTTHGTACHSGKTVTIYCAIDRRGFGVDHGGVRFPARTVTTVAAAGAVSSIYQQMAEAADKRRFPPPGRVIDIGGRRMHVLAMGGGSPAVIIVPALGANVFEWVRVLRASSAETTVCAYDRAGLGWSDPQRGAVNIDSMADDLHDLLKAAGIAPPYIIAGHSMGGIVARRFRSRYPADVAGMLLIDSSHEGQARRFGGYRDLDALKRAAGRQVRILGLRRLGVQAGFVSGFDAASLNRETGARVRRGGEGGQPHGKAAARGRPGAAPACSYAG